HTRHGKEIRDVNQIAFQALQRCPELAVSLQRALRSHGGHVMEIRGECPDLLNLSWRPDQEILVFMINPAKRSNNVADVCPDAKLSHPPDIDGDLHR
ncbi:MAG TPA: hypothetical protein VMU05_16865, partial [Dongiaceae bacterium]|nr:hypothetical protein [Dongiaceae bacterium]